jgi:hypothetical protein
MFLFLCVCKKEKKEKKEKKRKKGALSAPPRGGPGLRLS